MWRAGIKLALSGAFEGLLRGISAAWQWLISDWRHPPLVILAVGYFAFAFIITPALRSDLADALAESDAERAAHAGTVAAFLAATKEAEDAAEANAARVAREQEIITHDITSDYQARLADLRLRFERLRADAARTDPGRAAPADLPGLPDASGRADAAASDARLPAALSLDAALIASEQALQLDALISWVERQQAVRFTPEPAE